MSEQEEIFKKGQPIKHKMRQLHDATVWGYSETGKSVGVKHNIAHPNGVQWIIAYFSPNKLIKDSTE